MPTSIDIQKLFGLTILPKNVMLMLKLIVSMLWSKLLCYIGVTRRIVEKFGKLSKIVNSFWT